MEEAETIAELKAKVQDIEARIVGSPSTRCTEHTGQSERLISLNEKISTRLNLMTWILGILIVVVITFGGYIAKETSANTQDITLIKERQRVVLDWKDYTDKRMDTYERNLGKVP